jgi:hypothetical protein
MEKNLIEVLYDFLVQPSTSQLVEEILIQFITIFFSILPVFALAIGIYQRLKNKDGQEIKKHTINSILEELKILQTALNNPEFKPIAWESPQKRFSGNWILMETDSFDGSVNSGNFTFLSPNLQNTLSSLYLRIKNNNFLYFQVAKFYTTNTYQSNTVDIIAIKITEDMNDNILEIHGKIKDVIPKLETAKKYSRYL